MRRFLLVFKVFPSHLISVFSRSLFANAAVLYFNSNFVATVGAEKLSEIFLYASLFAISANVLFLFIQEKSVYKAYSLAVITVLIIGLWQSIFTDHIILLYSLGVGIYVVDFMGPSVLLMALQATSNPAVFRESYQRTVSTELTGRILAAGFISLISFLNFFDAFYYWSWAAIIVHLISFHYFLAKPSVRKNTHQDRNDFRRRVQQIKSGIQFSFSNSLVRIALFMVIWINATKFLVEYIFYQGLSQNFQSKEEIGAFVSHLTMATIFATLLAQATISKKLFTNLSLSMLLAVVPVAVLVLGSSALFLEPFLPLAMLMVFFQIAHRCIQLPLSKQCFVPVPQAQRKNINTIVMILSSVTGFTISGAMTLLQPWWDLPQFIIFTLVVAALVLIFTSDLDSFYVRNLWSYYREKTDGTWMSQVPMENAPNSDSIEAPLETLTPVVPTRSNWQDENNHINENLNLQNLRSRSRMILLGYAYTQDLLVLETVVDSHIKLLNSKNSDEIIVGLRILSELSINGSDSVFDKFTLHPDMNVRRMAKMYSKSMELLESFPLNGTTSYTRRKLRGLILELLQDSESDEKLERLKQLAKQKSEEWLAPVIELLTENRGIEIRSAILNCVKYPSHEIQLAPLLARLKFRSFDEAKIVLEAITKMGQREHRVEVFSHINKSLEILLSARFNLWKTEHDHLLMDEFFIVLHLEERMIADDITWNFVINTIKDLKLVDHSELPILIDMHLEYLKQSTIFPVWECIMKQKPNEQNYKNCLEVLTQAQIELEKLANERNRVASQV